MSAKKNSSFARRLAVPRPLWTLGSLLVIVVIVTVVGNALGGPILTDATATMCVYIVAVVGTFVFNGNSGVFSFGQVGFVAIGAYSAAAFRIPEGTKQALFPGLPPVTFDPATATLIGGVAAAFVGFVVALLVARVDGLAAALVTFAFLSIVFAIASNLKSITGGQTGLFGVPMTTTPMTALPWVLGAIVVAWAFGETRLCLQLRGTREDEAAAAAIGIGTWRGRVVSFTVSAFLCGISGGMFAQYLGTFNAEGFYLDLSLLTIAMLVVGGARTLSGAVIGAIFLSAVRAWLESLESGFVIGPLQVSAHPGLQDLGTAIALLAVLLFSPAGLTRGREIGPLVAVTVGRLWRRERDDAPAALPVESQGASTEEVHS